jgi:hypothetical protein
MKIRHEVAGERGPRPQEDRYEKVRSRGSLPAPSQASSAFGLVLGDGHEAVRCARAGLVDQIPVGRVDHVEATDWA